MAQQLADLDKGKLQAYGKYAIRLTTITMLVWFVVTCAAIVFSPELNAVVIFGFPLGYSLGAQGSLIIFLILVFNYAIKMNKADAACGVREETD